MSWKTSASSIMQMTRGFLLRRAVHAGSMSALQREPVCVGARFLATKAAPTQSPFAPPKPAADAAPTTSAEHARRVAREEERTQRHEAMAAMLREQTLREVGDSAKARRPDGLHHVLEADTSTEFGADYTPGKGEWGGPKGKRPPTRPARAR